MATHLRHTSPLAAKLRDAHNGTMRYIGAGAFFHLDKSEVIPVQGAASTDALAYALVNECLAVYQGVTGKLSDWKGHAHDKLAHKIDDTVDISIVTTPATSLVTAYALANALKAVCVAHCTASGVHYNNDGTNGVTLGNIADADSSGKLHTLANGLKAFLLAHLASGPAEASMIRLVSA